MNTLKTHHIQRKQWFIHSVALWQTLTDYICSVQDNGIKIQDRDEILSVTQLTHQVNNAADTIATTYQNGLEHNTFNGLHFLMSLSGVSLIGFHFLIVNTSNYFHHNTPISPDDFKPTILSLSPNHNL